MGARDRGSHLAVVAALVAALGAVAACSRDQGAGQEAGPSGAVTLEAGGQCLWLEHHGRQKYRNLCVHRAFGAEAELTSEWRPIGGGGGSAIAPDRLSHHVTAGETVSRESISVIVRSLEQGRVVVERL